MDFKDKINDAIKEENLDRIANLSKSEEQKKWLEHGGPFGVPVFPNIDGNGNGNGNRQGKGKQQKKSKSTEEKLPEEYVQKYSDANVIIESILIGNDPYFLIKENGKDIRIAEFYPTEIILKPYEPTSYINRPYVFSSKEEVEKYIEIVKKQTLDTLYKTVKSIWRKYIDADDFHITICAADTTFTYSQDKIGLTHYLFFVGNNNYGKTNNLDVFHFLAYRNMLSTDITSANIYQFLGSKNEGIGTICEDELDNIDDDIDKMKTYKMGYTKGKPIFRMLESNIGGRRKQTRLNTFCFKAFAAERLPDSMKAKGFNDRVLQIHCSYGFPDYDITEVVSPAGEQKFQTLLDELNEVRNKLLIYRLQHYNDTIPDIEIDLPNREKQLFKPLLRVFQNTETFNELLPVISQFVGKRRKATQDTFTAYLYGVLMELIRNHNSLELATSDIINTIKIDLQCEDIPHKPLSFESAQFGTLSQKKITNMLDEIFGATKSPHHGNSSKWTFDKDKLARLGKIYQLSPDIKVGVSKKDGEDVGLDKHFSNAENENKSGEVGYDGEDGEDVRKRPPISEDNLEQETSNNYNNSSNNDKEIQENDQSRASEDSKNIPLSSHDPPQVPQVPQPTQTNFEKPEGATFICKNCNDQQLTDCWELHKKSCNGN